MPPTSSRSARAIDVAPARPETRVARVAPRDCDDAGPGDCPPGPTREHMPCAACRNLDALFDAALAALAEGGAAPG